MLNEATAIRALLDLGLADPEIEAIQAEAGRLRRALGDLAREILVAELQRQSTLLVAR